MEVAFAKESSVHLSQIPFCLVLSLLLRIKLFVISECFLLTRDLLILLIFIIVNKALIGCNPQFFPGSLRQAKTLEKFVEMRFETDSRAPGPREFIHENLAFPYALIVFLAVCVVEQGVRLFQIIPVADQLCFVLGCCLGLGPAQLVVGQGPASLP